MALQQQVDELAAKLADMRVQIGPAAFGGRGEAFAAELNRLRQMTEDLNSETAQKLRDDIKETGDKIRQMKADKKPKDEVAAEVTKLNAAKKALGKLAGSAEERFDRALLEDVAKRRFIFGLANYIYGGVAGLYDYGPMGCAIKANLLNYWRQFFVLEEDMLEVDCAALTPEVVLKTSGHVDRFTDKMVRDTETHQYFRADHLLEDEMDKLMADPKLDANKKKQYEIIKGQADSYSLEELTSKLREFGVKAPETGNELTDAIDFNLMFGTHIGPTGLVKGFMRPETAQGIFVNFKRLLEYNAGRMPFGAAQIGNAWRNEIAPRGGLLRVREFTMAEIEHFVNPEDKQHPKFADIADLVVNLYPADRQLKGDGPVFMTLGKAVETGMIDNETLGYFVGRIYLFLRTIGLQENHLRFRQHLPTEMAHYACDCWDAEAETSSGWVEIVGCADRSAYDLTHHAAASKTDMAVVENLDKPYEVECITCTPNKKVIGKTFGKNAAPVFKYLDAASDEDLKTLMDSLNGDGKATVTVEGGETRELTKDMVALAPGKKRVTTKSYIPSVVEPSFGIGRIIYCVLEQNLYARADDAQRQVFRLSPAIAPYKVLVAPLSNNKDFNPAVFKLSTALKRAGVSSRVDASSTSIGRRYARADEIGIPFGITVDFETLKNDSATIRERDTMKQIRVPCAEIADVINNLSEGHLTWEAACGKYPEFVGQDV
eukprot:Clim_evm9s197 gene=Clim_evmTU9s197